jgi:hypothetical protein
MNTNMLYCPVCQKVKPHWATVGYKDGLRADYCRCPGCQSLRGCDGSGPWPSIWQAEQAYADADGYAQADADGSLSAWLEKVEAIQCA